MISITFGLLACRLSTSNLMASLYLSFRLLMPPFALMSSCWSAVNTCTLLKVMPSSLPAIWVVTESGMLKFFSTGAKVADMSLSSVLTVMVPVVKAKRVPFFLLGSCILALSTLTCVLRWRKAKSFT